MSMMKYSYARFEDPFLDKRNAESIKPKKVARVTENQTKMEYNSKGVPKYELLPVEKEIVLSINKTHPQLGGLVLFEMVVSTLRKLGVIVIGATGTGKSTAGRAIAENVKGITFFRCDGGFTPAKIKKEGLEEFLDRAILYADDITTFLANSTSVESFLTISQLIEAQCYYGGNIAQPIIEHADISFIGCATPWVISELISMGVWNSHIKERFVRIYWQYYKFPTDERGLPVTKPFLPKFDYTYKDVNRNLEWNVSAKKEKAVINMLEAQFSENRASNYARGLMYAHATLNNKNVVDDTDADFLLCYKPFIEIEKYWLYKPKIITHGVLQSGNLLYSDVFPEIISLCSFRPMTFEELRTKTNYGIGTLSSCLDFLEKEKFIKKVDDKYEITGKFAEEVSSFHEIFSQVT